MDAYIEDVSEEHEGIVYAIGHKYLYTNYDELIQILNKLSIYTNITFYVDDTLKKMLSEDFNVKCIKQISIN